MLNDPEKHSEAAPIEVLCYFVRERNALAVRAQFSDLYTDYYLHLMQHGIRYEPQQDQLVKDGLAAITLHLASRPWNEAVAWTLNWQDPLQNFFFTGSNRFGNVTGRLFTEDIREAEKSIFYSQTATDGNPARQSSIEAEQLDIFEIVESYYRQSEQRPGRFFRHSEEDLVFITAQPDCDLPWFHSLTDQDVIEMEEKETLSLLEKRVYRFDCGCSADKIFPIIANMPEKTIEEVFGGREAIEASCPRCGAHYALTREALEAFQGKDGA